MPDSTTTAAPPAAATETPATLTAEAVEKLLEARENKLAAEFRRFRDNEVKAREALTKQLAEQFATLKPPEATEGTQAEAPAESPDQRALRIASQKQADEIEKLKASLVAERQEREKAEADKRAQEERVAASEALASGGVTEAPRVKAALAVLASEGRIVRDEKGGICFRVQGKFGEELVPVAEGVRGWLATEDGKLFVPPRDAKGSGTSPGGPASLRAGGKRTDREWADALAAIWGSGH